ncbi:hypothetical protein GC174_11320 [bacterium]|nr:hypothetical protein [bacterium]
MKKIKKRISESRKNQGSAIAEFGACFAAFFVFAFIPSVNVAAYLAGCYLAEDITSSCADRISKANDSGSLTEMVAAMNCKLEDGKALAIFWLKAEHHPISVELAVESPEREYLYDLDDIDNIETSQLNRARNLIRYKITAAFITNPVFDLSAVPGIGSAPIIARPSKISRTIYREIEHPEFLSNKQDSLHAQFTKASR